MALIKCKECGKEISDQAKSCPHCGCPVTPPQKTDSSIGSNPAVPNFGSPAAPNGGAPVVSKKRFGCLRTFLFALLGVFAIGVIIAIAMIITGVPSGEEIHKSSIGRYIDDISDEQGLAIDDILTSCGIADLDSVEHDELLDDVHFEGETGYRISSEDINNIILYLDADNNVYSIRYADHDLYADGKKIASLTDYTMTINEMTKWQLLCENKVKEVLKSPSSAKFPNILEWKFRKEKNIITVQSYVDAQNSFGAMIRSDFQFKFNSDDNTITSFIFDNEQII